MQTSSLPKTPPGAAEIELGFICCPHALQRVNVEQLMLGAFNLSLASTDHEEISFETNVEQVWHRSSSSHHPSKQAEWILNAFL